MSINISVIYSAIGVTHCFCYESVIGVSVTENRRKSGPSAGGARLDRCVICCNAVAQPRKCFILFIYATSYRTTTYYESSHMQISPIIPIYTSYESKRRLRIF